MACRIIKLGVGVCNILKRNICTQSKIVSSCLKRENQWFRRSNSGFITFSSQILEPYEVNWSIYRYYAKGKDKKKSDKGGPKQKLELNEDVVSKFIQMNSMRNSMQLAVDHLKDEYIKNLSLRSATGSLETLELTFEGKTYTLQELAQVVRKNPKTIIINLNSFPLAIPAVITALSKSGMNLNPQQDGTTLFVPIPKVTKEHRENLSKNAKALFLKCRDNIRDIKNKYTRAVKNQEKDGLSQDLSHQICEQFLTMNSVHKGGIICRVSSKQAWYGLNELVQIHEAYIEEASKILLSKQQELMGES